MGTLILLNLPGEAPLAVTAVTHDLVIGPRPRRLKAHPDTNPVIAAPPLGAAPDFADHTLEVCAQNFFDHRCRLAAFGEFGGDDFHVIGAV